MFTDLVSSVLEGFYALLLLWMGTFFLRRNNVIEKALCLFFLVIGGYFVTSSIHHFMLIAVSPYKVVMGWIHIAANIAMAYASCHLTITMMRSEGKIKG